MRGSQKRSIQILVIFGELLTQNETCVGCGQDYIGSGSGKWKKDDLIPLPNTHEYAPGKVCPDCWEELGLNE